MAFRYALRKQMVEAYQSFYVAMVKFLLFRELSKALLLASVDLHHSLEIMKKAAKGELFKLANDSLDCQ